MNRHVKVNGKLLQVDKKYSQLKLRQKDKIAEWLYGEYRRYFREHGKQPDETADAKILYTVMEKIEEAGIWIPEYEVEKHYRKIKKHYQSRIRREVNVSLRSGIVIEPLADTFSVCRVEDYSGIDISQPFCFTAHTDEENSLVCPAALVPANTTDRNDGWKGFRIKGQLDFSLIGILSGILKILADNEISVFAVSTFNTDYVFVREEDFQKAIQVLKDTYTVIVTEESLQKHERMYD